MAGSNNNTNNCSNNKQNTPTWAFAFVGNVPRNEPAANQKVKQ